MEWFAADTAPDGYRRRYNVRPTQAVPVILNTKPGQIELARSYVRFSFQSDVATQ